MKDIFKPTKTKLKSSDYYEWDFLHLEGDFFDYFSNCYFSVAIPFLKIREPKIYNMISNCHIYDGDNAPNYKTFQKEVENNLLPIHKTGNIKIIENTPVVEFQANDAFVYLNAYYVAVFNDAEPDYWQEKDKPLGIVVVKLEHDVIGHIAPVKL